MCVWQVALQNWKALHKNPGFFVSGGQGFSFHFFGVFLMNPFLDGWSAAVKNHGLHSALPCVILGPFNICYVLVVAGHVLASSLLEASILLALLAATLPRVQVQSLLPLLGFGVLVVLATKFLLGLLTVMERSSVLRVDGGRLDPCRGRLDRLFKWIVTFVSLLRTCLISHLH